MLIPFLAQLAIYKSSTRLIQGTNTMRNFILLLLTLFSILPLLVLSKTHQGNKFSECTHTSYRCGGDDAYYDISYPFRVQGMPERCGLPGFDVACKHNDTDKAMLVLEISDKEYKVGNISYENQTINLVDTDFLGDTCPRAFLNTTFNTSLFSYVEDDFNLTIYSNCSSGLLDNPDLRKVSCEPWSDLYSPYYCTPGDEPHRIAELSRNCDSRVLIPFLSEHRRQIWDNRVLHLKDLRYGFDLNWTSDATKWCKGCNDTGGICVRDLESPGKPSCACNDGSITNGNCEKSEKKIKKIIQAAVGAGAAALLVCCLVFLVYNRRKRQRQASLSNLLSLSDSSTISSKRDSEFGGSSFNTHIFTYHELQEATDNFSESRELGDGGFGAVYKGILRDGRTVAVKRLYENNYRRLEQFKNEIDILSRLRHPNLVSLYGCTSGRSRELLLVYEYVPNGTLADHLHGSLASKELLSWPIRMSIAIETADALAYLHAVEPPIIHRDVKTTNILIDNNFHVKVADFGLSRLFPLDATHVSTAPQGTPGYVDPEYHQCFQLTNKSDVYSFGVVLVELISSKPAVDISRRRHEINLATMAVTKIQNCQIDQLVDSELGYQSDLEITRMINQVAELAFRCLQSDGEMRPCIKEVLKVLRGIECGGKEEEDHVEVSEVQTKEETQLLKHAMTFSPDTVTEQWPSRSTTPNISA